MYMYLSPRARANRSRRLLQQLAHVEGNREREEGQVHHRRSIHTGPWSSAHDIQSAVHVMSSFEPNDPPNSALHVHDDGVRQHRDADPTGGREARGVVALRDDTILTARRRAASQCGQGVARFGMRSRSRTRTPWRNDGSCHSTLLVPCGALTSPVSKSIMGRSSSGRRWRDGVHKAEWIERAWVYPSLEHTTSTRARIASTGYTTPAVR
ncbi:hypothetical protein OH77DRAFT_1144887 [Trametes cingulata]|nr:hypothetical protein OH77DRAFT_1144887 [Trametes cingulata]